MLLCARWSNGVVALRALVAFGVALLSAPALGVEILEIRGATLTSYPGSATTEQGILPLHDQRGTGIDGTLRAGSPFGWGLAGNPFGEPSGGQLRWGEVRLDLGAYAPTDIDLALPAQGAGRWVVGRTFNSRQASASNGVQGRNWMQTSQPELVFAAGGTAATDTLMLVYGADRYVEFQRTGLSSNEFKGKNGAAGMMQYASGSPDTYIYYMPDGTRVWFFGGNTGSSRANWQLWKIADAAGNTAYVGDKTTASTAVTSGYDASGNLTTAYDDFGADGRRYSYTYTTLDSVVRLTQVKAEVLTAGTWSSPSGTAEVGRVDYDYYQTGGTTYGDIGCLKTVSVTTPLTDSGVSVTRTKAYRYWSGSYNGTTNPGHPYEIQYVVDYEGYRAADWADTTFDDDPLSMTESSLKPFAAAYFEYDSAGRIKKAWTNGQCGCAGGSGNGVHEFTYDDNSLSTKIANTTYDTAWGERTVIVQPDGTYVVQYFDETGAPLSRVLVDGNPAVSVTNLWATEVIRNSDGQVSEIRTPEANSSYDHTTGAFTPESGDGLIREYDRVGSGDAKGFIEAEKVKKGTGGTVEYERSRTYSSRNHQLTSGNDVIRPVLTASRVFHTTTTNPADSTKYDETGHAYGWADSTNTNLDYIVLKRSTTTLATASTGKNGSNVATEQERYYRKDGSVAYERRTQSGALSSSSADRKYNYTKMVDGLVTQTVQDADVDNTGKYTGGDDPTQSGWSINLSNMAGLDLTQNRGYDAQGRSDETTLPTGRVTKMYYSKLADRRLVTISFPHKNGSTLYGPASYTVTNHAGRVEAQALVRASLQRLHDDKGGGQTTGDRHLRRPRRERALQPLRGALRDPVRGLQR